MGKLVNYVTSLHQSTPRKYIDRMVDEKVVCMLKAKEYEFDYWDGDRRFGYGGYKFLPGRWKPVAEALIKEYKLTNSSKILDVGCGKAFLLHEMKLILPDLKIVGFDISEHGLSEAMGDIRENLLINRINTSRNKIIIRGMCMCASTLGGIIVTYVLLTRMLLSIK